MKLYSFKYAFKGLLHLFKAERNAKIHSIAAVLTIILSIYLKIAIIEWIIIIFCISLVIALEAINTSIERICDRVSKEHHPLIEQSKDVAAGAVLLMSIASVIIACLIFIPKF